ncbi:MAG: zf-HC2 domain-containing protein [Nocardioides sp.]
MTNDDAPPECAAAREALSALVDHEEPGLGADWLTEHLVSCAGCREWYAAARELRRRTRLQPLPAMPELTGSILAAVGDADPSRRPHATRATDLLSRYVAAAVALALLWFQAPLLLFGRDPDVGVHPAHELGSFGAALAICLLVAAFRPRWGRRFAPLFGVVAVLLLATAALDLIHGSRTTWADEAPHLLWLVGWAALRTMPSQDDGPSAGSSVLDETDGTATGTTAPVMAVQAGRPQRTARRGPWQAGRSA